MYAIDLLLLCIILILLPMLIGFIFLSDNSRYDKNIQIEPRLDDKYKRKNKWKHDKYTGDYGQYK